MLAFTSCFRKWPGIRLLPVGAIGDNHHTKAVNRMPADSAGEKTQGDMLRGILVNYLLASRVARWPGVDGFTEDDILELYPSLSADGEVPAYAELCRRHAELHSEIQSLFTRKGWRQR